MKNEHPDSKPLPVAEAASNAAPTAAPQKKSAAKNVMKQANNAVENGGLRHLVA